MLAKQIQNKTLSVKEYVLESQSCGYLNSVMHSHEAFVQ